MDVNYRLLKLKELRSAIIDKESEIINAINSDFKKSELRLFQLKLE
ncbi:MAG: hypothetical protein R2771_13830 [Saprospiraceae bacterium]